MTEQVTANDFVDVKDIKGNFLYTRNNYIFCYLRIYPFNLDLLTMEDRRTLTNRLAAAFDGDRKNFIYCTLPRELDLDVYKAFLKEKRQLADFLGKKRIVDELIKKATELSSDTENYEHQHYYKFWIDSSNLSSSQAEIELRDRAMRFRDMYRDVQIPCEILEEREIIKLCNLYSNRRSANYDVYSSVTSTPLIRG